MPDFDHAGHKIHMNPANGKFSAIIDGEQVVKPSLPAIKKAIEKSMAIAFKPHTAIASVGYNTKKGKIGDTGYTRVKVLRPPVLKNARWRGKVLHFTVESDSGGTVEITDIYKDEPGTLAAIKAMNEFDKKERRIKEELEREEKKVKEAFDKFKIRGQS